MDVPLASPRVRAAIKELVVGAEQLQLMVTRAAVARHPLHPALERLALSVLRTASRAVHEAAGFIAEESARGERSARP